jgi:hypothetical protein
MIVYLLWQRYDYNYVPVSEEKIAFSGRKLY